MLTPSPESDRLDQLRVNTGELPAFDDRAGGDLEEIQDLTDAKTVTAAPYLEYDDRTLVRRPPLLLQQEMPVEDGEEAATDVDQPFDRVRHAGNSGSRQAGEDLTHDPCRGRADNLTDSKDDGVKRGRVSHLY